MDDRELIRKMQEFMNEAIDKIEKARPAELRHIVPTGPFYEPFVDKEKMALIFGFMNISNKLDDIIFVRSVIMLDELDSEHALCVIWDQVREFFEKDA